MKKDGKGLSGLGVCARMHDPDDVLSYLATGSQRLAKRRTMLRIFGGKPQIAVP